MILPILHWPDPRLSTRCAPVSGDVSELAADLLETMYAAPGRGLAAPQVGVLDRLFVVDVDWKQGAPNPMVFVNPEIVARLGETTGEERCLSIPGVGAEVKRSAEVTVRWMGLDGLHHEGVFDGATAVCIQHECDHLDGMVIFDRVSSEQRLTLEAAYKAAQD